MERFYWCTSYCRRERGQDCEKSNDVCLYIHFPNSGKSAHERKKHAVKSFISLLYNKQLIYALSPKAVGIKRTSVEDQKTASKRKISPKRPKTRNILNGKNEGRGATSSGLGARGNLNWTRNARRNLKHTIS